LAVSAASVAGLLGIPPLSDDRRSSIMGSFQAIGSRSFDTATS
jgi:hypothetical protein